MKLLTMERVSYYLVVLFAIGLAACNENWVRAPKPPESDPQFVLERSMNSATISIFVLRDKVNGKLIYVTPGAGVAVSEDE
jgi:hypothetical protein